MKNKCELLAPAGGFEQFIAAIENGADTVYLGAKEFNARINAGNFTDNEIEEAIDYGHLRGVKTYITMNTLISDEELSDALNLIVKYYNMGADAFIIQDLGLGELVRKYYPEIEMHLSTQAGIYDREGVEKAGELGYKRVVMARESTLEVYSEAAKSGVEIEAFIHGALCMCYSGQCQFSRFIGGRSGNRGECAQPCRLRYTGLNSEYPLSPKDLSLIDHIGEMIENGISSLKIEGRMKSPEYVAIVTSIYRKYIDEYYQKGTYEVSEEDKTKLAQAFNRGNFTTGYLLGDPEEDLMAGDFSKNGGVYLGKAKRHVTDSILEVEVEEDKNLILHDFVEIRSKERTGFLVTYLNKTGKNRFEIGDLKGECKDGDLLYRIISKDLTDEAQKTFSSAKNGNGKRKTPCNFELIAMENKPLKLIASTTLFGKRYDGICESSVLAEPSQKGESNIEEFKSRLSKTGGTPFEAKNIKIVENTPIFIRASELNALRREALRLLENNIINSFKRDLNEVEFELSEIEEKPGLEIYVVNGEVLDEDYLKKAKEGITKKTGFKEMTFVVPIRDYYRLLSNGISGEYRLMPYLLPMIGKELKEWLIYNRKELGQMLKENETGIYLGNIGQINFFRDLGVDINIDYGVNIYNNAGKELMKYLGAKRVYRSLESLDKTHGNYPLMLTEHEFKGNSFRDRKNARYNIKFDSLSHKSIVTSAEDNIDWKAVSKSLKEGSFERIYI